jgi:aryl-alcohol dehydrogenase-like predicted oxidoreductase
MYTGTIRRFGSWDVFQELLAAMAGIGKKHGVSVATVAERYVLQQESVGAAIIGVRNTKHIKESIDAFGFELDADDMKKLEGVLSKSEGPIGDIYGYERGLV